MTIVAESSRLWFRSRLEPMAFIAGRVAPPLSAALVVPFLTRTLGLREFGLYVLLLAVAVVASALLASWADLAVARFAPAALAHDRTVIRGTTVCTVLLATLCVASCSVVVCLVAGQTSLALDAAAIAAVAAASSWAMLEATTLRSELRPFAFARLQFAVSTGRGLGAIVPSLLGFGARGALFGVAAGTAIGCIGVGVPRAGIDGQLLRRLLRYGAPLSLVGLGTTGMMLADRLLLGAMTPHASLGVYAVAYAVADQPLSLLSSSLMLATFPRLVRLYDREARDVDAELALCIRRWAAIAVPAAVSIVLWRRELLELVGAGHNTDAAVIVPLVVAGSVAYGLAQYVAVPLQLHRRVRMYGSLLAGCFALNIVANVVLIPRYGIVGAAIATVIAYAALVSVCGAVSRVSSRLTSAIAVAALGSIAAIYAMPQVPSFVRVVFTCLIWFAALRFEQRTRVDWSHVTPDGGHA
jgi:O-antigen/teichoic acid export membrane protein